MFSNFFYNLQENALPRQSNETKDGKGCENSSRPKVDWFAILKNRAHIGRKPYYNISKLCSLSVQYSQWLKALLIFLSFLVPACKDPSIICHWRDKQKLAKEMFYITSRDSFGHQRQNCCFIKSYVVGGQCISGARIANATNVTSL